MTSIGGLRASILPSQEPAGTPLRLAQRTTAPAAKMSSRRSVRSPLREVRPSRSLPPVDLCIGVRPTLLAEQNIAGCARAMRLEHVLGQVQADGANITPSTDVSLRWSPTPPPWHVDAVGGVPHHCHTATFLAGLRQNDITSPLVLNGPMTGAAVKAYVEQFLVPTLYPDDVVMLDNLAA